MGRRTQPEVREGEQGYLLLAMVVMVSLVLIALAVAAPVVARDLRRDKEVESMHRQEEYVRALRLYYRKFKSYPPSMDALEKSNNVRYLRKQYIDPLTGKADWRIIHVGENQTTVKGFFGEPLGGISSTGIGGGGLGSASGMASGPTNALAAGFASSSGTNPGASSNSGGGTGGGITGGGGGSGGLGSTGPGGITTLGGSGTSSSSSSSSGFGSGGVGQIMGVGTAKSGNSILTPNQQTTYDTWEFLYDPRIELMYAKSNILGGGGLGSQSAGSFGSDAATGQNNSGSGTTMNGLPGQSNQNSPGSGLGGFGSPSSPTPPTTPH
jgi:type II secretory pathway pseudopilin PulG